ACGDLVRATAVVDRADEDEDATGSRDVAIESLPELFTPVPRRKERIDENDRPGDLGIDAADDLGPAAAPRLVELRLPRGMRHRPSPESFGDLLHDHKENSYWQSTTVTPTSSTTLAAVLQMAARISGFEARRTGSCSRA